MTLNLINPLNFKALLNVMQPFFHWWYLNIFNCSFQNKIGQEYSLNNVALCKRSYLNSINIREYIFRNCYLSFYVTERNINISNNILYIWDIGEICTHPPGGGSGGVGDSPSVTVERTRMGEDEHQPRCPARSPHTSQHDWDLLSVSSLIIIIIIIINIILSHHNAS